MMNIIYASCTCSKKKFNELFKDLKYIPGQQVQKYHRLIMEGLTMNGDRVKTMTALPITQKNCVNKYIKQNVERDNNIEFTYLRILNFPILKNILIFIDSFFTTLKYLRKDKQAVLICDILNISVSTGALLASKLLRRKNIGIVTDLPCFLTNTKSFIAKFNMFVLQYFGSYVFLTDQMNALVNKRNVPYVIIEGQVDIKMENTKNNIENKYLSRVCMYAGALKKIYGIEYLTEAFIKANIPDSELHIYGSGDFENQLVEICKIHNNIKYFGVVPNDIVVQEELKATILINPRPINEEYTKYSFPSKNMEYMVSGTPVLTTKLPGMPEEYCEYVYLFEEESVDAMCEKLRHVLSIPRKELHNKGLDSKRFVLNEKNNIVQAKKIVYMINETRRV